MRKRSRTGIYYWNSADRSVRLYAYTTMEVNCLVWINILGYLHSRSAAGDMQL